MTALGAAGGFFLGLASAAHCAGMCGGIGSGLALTLAGDKGPWDRLRVLLIAQAGKLVSYVLPGAVLGAAGASFYGLFDPKGAHLLLQWVAALGLCWIGLSLMGLVPSFAAFDRVVAPLRRWAFANKSKSGWTALVAGLAWGLLPCGMVYSALVFAMISGSALSGAETMAGFGLGVIPAVTATSMGVSWLPALARKPVTRTAIGALLVLIGLGTLAWPMAARALHCG